MRLRFLALFLGLVQALAPALAAKPRNSESPHGSTQTCCCGPVQEDCSP